MAGWLGAAIACRCFALGWLARTPGTRVVDITRKGSVGLKASFAFDPHAPQLPASARLAPDPPAWPVPLRA